MDLQPEIVQALQLHLLQHMVKEPVKLWQSAWQIYHGSEHYSGPSRGRGRGHRSRSVAQDIAVKTEHLSQMMLLLDLLMQIDLFHQQGAYGKKMKNLIPYYVFTYAAKHSLNVPFTVNTSAVELFYSLFTEEVWALLITEINQCVQQNFFLKNPILVFGLKFQQKR